MDENTHNDDLTIEPLDDKKKKKPQPMGDEEFVAEDGEGNTGTTKDQVADLREKLKKALTEKQEYLDGWQRMKADFVNARKREEETRKEVVKYATEDLIMQMMPVLDSFTMAFANKEAWEKVDKNWRVGVEYIHAQLMGVLQQNGFAEFDPQGEGFDPVKHNAVEIVPVTDKAQDHKVLEVIQKGYTLNGKIIRPARVKIGDYKDNA